MIRVFAAAAFVAAGAVTGSALASKLRREQRICAAICSLFSRTAFLVGYRGDDVYSVCSELRRDTELAPLTFLNELPETYSSGADFRDIWRSSVTSQTFGAEETELLIRLGSIIGRSDSASQCETIDQLGKRAAELEKRRAETSRQKGRLYRSVGLLLGVISAILVI
jgi:stage III sporulation protein AB